MPALGMAQSTGRLLRWLKPAGSAVRIGEALFEVETDKTTMEVEAQADGVLGAIAAAEGEDVPVGQVIARIANHIAAGTAPAAVNIRPPDAIPAPLPAAVPVPRPVTVPLHHPPANARILASPKARRLARVEGLDLSALVHAGHPQPYHAADIARLRGLSAPVTATEARPVHALLHVAARTPRSGSDAFLARMRNEAGVTLERHARWLAFAAAAWRAVHPARGALVVERQHPGAPATRWLDPDLARLSAQPDAGEAAPDLILQDLTGTCLTALRAAPAGVPVFGIADDGDTLRLSLDAGIAGLSPQSAQAVLTDLARRLADPLLFLV